MNNKTIFYIISLAFALILGQAQGASAASTVSVSSSGNGVFTLQGAMEGVGAMDITITYDTASLSNPRLENGGLISGALTAVNLNIPGTVRMAIIRTTPIQGSGVIATLTFDRKGASPGKITALSARLSNTDGRQLAAVVQVVNPTGTGTTASEQPAQQEGGQGVSASSGKADASQPVPTPGAPIGIVVLPPAAAGGTDAVPGTAAPKEEQAAPQEQAAEPAKEPMEIARKTERETPLPDKGIHTHKSVLERFQEYTGERTPKAYVSLFEQDGALGFRQEPTVVIADGKTPVKVVFISDPGKKDSSDVVVAGARLVSMKQDPDYTNTWIAELKPVKDVYEASMAVSLKTFTIVFPLVVAPGLNIDLDKSGKVTEADFVLFLKKRGTPKAPEFDLNGDGRRDYVDEYIFTANYLATGGTKTAPAGK